MLQCLQCTQEILARVWERSMAVSIPVFTRKQIRGNHTLKPFLDWIRATVSGHKIIKIVKKQT